MENLKLKMIDFTMKNNEAEETDMIFLLNSGEIKIYLDYQTGELKKIDYCVENDKLENSIILDIPLKLKGSVKLNYKYGLYGYVEIEIEKKMEKYLFGNSAVYLLPKKEIFLEVEITGDESLYFDEKYSLIGLKRKILKSQKSEQETKSAEAKKWILKMSENIKNNQSFSRKEIREKIKDFDKEIKREIFDSAYSCLKMGIEEKAEIFETDSNKTYTKTGLLNIFYNIFELTVYTMEEESAETEKPEEKLTEQELRKRAFLKRNKITLD